MQQNAWGVVAVSTSDSQNGFLIIICWHSYHSLQHFCCISRSMNLMHSWLLVNLPTFNESAFAATNLLVAANVLWYLSCRVKLVPSLTEIHPESRWISIIYSLLQCQSSSGSVGKSIWEEFRRPMQVQILAGSQCLFCHHLSIFNIILLLELP